jgi:hypothetical protein
MENINYSKEFVAIILATIILSISYLYPNMRDSEKFIMLFAGFFIIIITNILAKKFTAYNLKADIQTKFWSMYHFGFAEKRHFKKPLPMLWIPPFLSLISRGAIAWLPILDFDIKPRIERITKKHELYRFAQVTEWHLSIIVFWGIIANLLLCVFLSLIGLQEIGKLSLYYATWLIIPFSTLDGSKLLFGSRKLWLISGILILLTFIWQSTLF